MVAQTFEVRRNTIRKGKQKLESGIPIVDKSDDQLPTLQTINTKVNRLGYTLKKIEKTDEIFEKIGENARCSERSV